MELPYLLCDDDGPGLGGVIVPGAAVISQSCDIINSGQDRLFVQVARLAKMEPNDLKEVQKRRRPRYGYLSGLAALGMAVDFDIVATVHKKVVAQWVHNGGCTTDFERRDFAEALARHRRRFAFPQEFNNVMWPIRDWLDRAKKKTDTFGNFVRSINQIRVICDNWHTIGQLDFIVVFDDEGTPAEALVRDQHLEEMLGMIATKYSGTSIRQVTWDNLSAREMNDSDQLDFDGLSQVAPPAA